MGERQGTVSAAQSGEAPAPFSTGSVPPARSRKRPLYACGIPGGVILLGWALNYFLVGQPVASTLAEDPRNSAYSLSAHYRYYIDPTTLVLDLRVVRSPAPTDLFRAVFQSAKALNAAGRRFEQVILARSRTPVFAMGGGDFSNLGEEFGTGQNPVYLIRTLPEKHYKTNGEAAFGRGEGGLIGVLSKQMEEANEAARQWSDGS